MQKNFKILKDRVGKCEDELSDVAFEAQYAFADAKWSKEQVKEIYDDLKKIKARLDKLKG